MENLEIFSTCPQSRGQSQDTYVRHVMDAARWSEEAGCRGMLVYADNGLVDPWLVAQIIIQHTSSICPLVAVQPVYMPPYTAAKMVASLAFLHRRRVWLNMVAGGFPKDLLALGDTTPHDARYERLIEYVRIVQALLRGVEPVSFAGTHYQVRALTISPPLPPELTPEIVISGSSAAGMTAARELGATPVTYPRPASEEVTAAAASDTGRRGMRLGIIAREDGEEAWRIAYARFPDTRAGRITHRLAMKLSDSQWHRQLSDLGAHPSAPDDPYWLGPFQTSSSFCPYLVGSYQRVAQELSSYIASGASMFILDIPASREELEHTMTAFGIVVSQRTNGRDPDASRDVGGSVAYEV
jgi:alkanesulfonate monooxygenase